MHETYSVRPLKFEDLPDVLAWRNRPEVRRFMFTQHEISLEEHRNWFCRVNQDITRQMLIVEDAGQPIGYVQFSNISKDIGGVADWGFYKRPGAEKGSGLKLGLAALNHAYQILELHKVCGQSLEHNLASIDFHKKLGFTEEGFLREQVLIDSTYHSVLCFGLLRQEWLQIREILS